MIHLAAHGYVDPALPQRTGIALSFEQAADGYLAIGDVLEIVLDANLVVLSACETARGEIRSGEGIQSMARAFLFAGARAVAASLWRVSDAATSETMRRFYEGALKERKPFSEALREAKISLRESGTLRAGGDPRTPSVTSTVPDKREDWRHPHFWAPFVYVGLPR